MLRKVFGVVGKQQARAESVLFADAFFAKFKDGGPADEAVDELLCADCGRWFHGLAGWKRHRNLVHSEGGASQVASASVVGSVCPFCDCDFQCRIHLSRDLCHGAASCKAALLSGALPFVLPR
jgi:hypothetical protein